MKATLLGAPEIIMDNPMSLHNYFAWPSAVRLKNGKDRLYIYNPDEYVYGHAVVTCENEPQAIDIHSHYPVLPVRFLTEGNTGFAFDYTKKVAKNRFQTKTTPAGVTIVDITF